MADDSVCDLIFSACIGCEVVKQRNMSAQIRNRTADHHGYNTHLFQFWLHPASVWPSAEKQDKSWTQEHVFQGCCWELAHTVVQMHGLSCNMRYYTGTWGSLNDFDFLDDIRWNIPMYFTLSWKALLVSCILCRILAALNDYNWLIMDQWPLLKPKDKDSFILK